MSKAENLAEDEQSFATGPGCFNETLCQLNGSCADVDCMNRTGETDGYHCENPQARRARMEILAKRGLSELGIEL